jgi:hypothetical protein
MLAYAAGVGSGGNSMSSMPGLAPNMPGGPGAHFTCFNGTKVQILTPEKLRARGCASDAGG